MSNNAGVNEAPYGRLCCECKELDSEVRPVCSTLFSQQIMAGHVAAL